MIWYVAYGSNLCPDRFRHYLGGGGPAGAQRHVPGARNPSDPSDERAVTIPGRMFFGWRSTTWGGGVAFLDADADDTAYGRAYLVTDEQFADIVAQEMHRDPGTDLDLAQVLENRRHCYGPGRYETVHLVGELEGDPMLTFTAEDPSDIPLNAPVPAYVETIARGLRITHGLSDDEAREHLRSRPGASSVWEDVEA